MNLLCKKKDQLSTFSILQRIVFILFFLGGINANTIANNIGYETFTSEKQGITITGTIIDEKGETVPGVNITLKGTNTGTASGADGQYSITIPNQDAVLVFSFVGYVTQEFPIENRTTIDVVLKEDSHGIDEVVVIGYGAMKKSDLTGSIATVKVDKIVKSTAASIGDMLSGRASGLNVFKSSAQPGGDVTFLIRGAASTVSNAPLIVVDGFPLTNMGEPSSGNRYSSGSKSPLTTINPDDVASIEILKDASSTAIYGARAANGVILITTKRGQSGLKVSYDGSYSFQNFSEKWDMLDGSEYLLERNRYQIEYAKLSQKITPYGNNPLSDFILPKNLYSEAEINAAGKGTDWVDNVLRSGVIKKHNLSISGGNDKTTYLASLNIFEDKGIILNYSYSNPFVVSG